MIDSMTEFAESWGIQNLQAMKIEGFSADDPPPPPLPERLGGPPQEPVPVPDEDAEPIYQWPKSPLIPKQPAVVAPANDTPSHTPHRQVRERDRPFANLVILDDAAEYMKQKTQLTPQEQAAVGRIILESVHRRIKAQLAETVAAAPRRARKAKPTTAAPTPEPAKRKRGRPRKVPIV